MHRLSRIFATMFAPALLLFFANTTWAQEDVELTECATCHESVGSAAGDVHYEARLAGSVHAGISCDACHQSIDLDDLDITADNPHGVVEPPNCAFCHEDAAEQYEMHGRVKVAEDPDVPRCWDCHGSHGILPSNNPKSHTYPANIPDQCRRCHEDLNLVKRHENLRTGPIHLYESSVHGVASQKGLTVAATCNDCHSARTEDGKPTAHRILSAANPESTIFHFNIPDTCGQCHESTAQEFWEGMHGKLVKLGSVDSPVCTNCHGEHGILSPDDPRSPVSPTHVAEQTCARCHESAVLNEKYGLPSQRLASYVDSYHGLKSKAGDPTVANCASCHGAHLILPSTDPRSSIYAGNLRHTCGECHPGISKEMATMKIHETGTGIYTGWPRIFEQIYIVLIIVTIGFMLLHNFADWLRHVRDMQKKPFVQRLSVGEVMQHWALMISFTVLVISGFALRFSEADWVQWIFGWEGGFQLRGVVHRAAGVLLIVSAVWHLLYVITRRGRRSMIDMLPRFSDFKHFGQNIQYFLGKRDKEPGFQRFSYMEKLEYWALAWGTALMSITGLFLWFDRYATEMNVPKGVLDVLLVVHYYEAWLAMLAILVWHVYGTIFKPKVYPMNPAWITGKMPALMYHHEHPEGPKLTPRIIQPRTEEEVEWVVKTKHYPAESEAPKNPGGADNPGGEGGKGTE